VAEYTRGSRREPARYHKTAEAAAENLHGVTRWQSIQEVAEESQQGITRQQRQLGSMAGPSREVAAQNLHGITRQFARSSRCSLYDIKRLQSLADVDVENLNGIKRQHVRI
jgi:hypothetical protein